MKKRYGTICLAIALIWLFVMGIKLIPPSLFISAPLILGLIVFGIIALTFGRGTWKLW